MRSLGFLDCAFESRRWRGYLSLVSIVFCQVEVSASDLSLVQMSPTECGVSEYDREVLILRRTGPLQIQLLIHTSFFQCKSTADYERNFLLMDIYYPFSVILQNPFFCRVAQILTARSPWRQNVIQWRLMFGETSAWDLPRNTLLAPRILC